MKDKQIVMYFTGSFFLIGQLVGEKMLKEPRVLNLMNGGKEFQIAGLPGLPDSLTIIGGGFRCVVKDTNVIDAYNNVISGEPVEDPRIITTDEEKRIIVP